MLFFQLGILLLCIVIGARLGGIALGTGSGIGLAFFMMVLGMPPGNPPAVVLGMILAVITALSMIQLPNTTSDKLCILGTKIKDQYCFFHRAKIGKMAIFKLSKSCNYDHFKKGIKTHQT